MTPKKNTVSTQMFVQRKNWTFLLCLICSALLAVTVICTRSLNCFAADGGAHSDQIKVLRLVQSHQFLGAVVLNLAGDKLRMDSTGRMRFTLVASAPTWNVSVFRNDDKVIKTQSYKRFTASGLVSEMVLSVRPHFLQSEAQPYHFKYYGFDARRVVNHADALEYLPPGGVITPEIANIVGASFRFPDGMGLCLHFMEASQGRDFITGMDTNGQKEICLSTSSIKWTWVPKDFFDAPRGYKETRDMQQVVTSSKIRDQSADFQNLLDSSEKSKAGARHWQGLSPKHL
jgi:hypothetical protein